ncbi:MAG: polyphosphate kinase 1 [Candidatus Riflebacteria bacterium]|nr:polyphosphate kinase 1 [Candidatus Riflebacteria bacterium]
MHDPASRLVNRELSWLAFNERVLEEAFDPLKPPLERLKFLCIFATNLAEFFLIRVAGLKHPIPADVADLSPDGLSPAEQIRQIHSRVRELVARRDPCLLEGVLPTLARFGIVVHPYRDLQAEAQQVLSRYFASEVFPVVTPLAVDPGHPFPHLLNLGLNLALVLDPQRGQGEPVFAVLQVPSVLPRLVPLRDMRPGHHFVPLEEVTAHHAVEFFPGYKVRIGFPFRVTRDADFEIAEAEADDLIQSVQQSLRMRDKGAAVRLEVPPDAPAELVDGLAADLGLDPTDVFRVQAPLNLADFMRLTELDYPALKDPAFTPRAIGREKGESLFTRARNADILLHHPYDSFDPVVELITQAAEDPRVLAIKQTLYRTAGGDSPIIRALARAAENGKQVTALVELKARFDEKANIRWARALEDAGVHVVYGLIGLKTHCKIALVVRKEEDGIRRYVHMSTGNYNHWTARLYTDLGLITCRPEIGADATQLFNLLTGYSLFESWKKTLVSPRGMRTRLMELVAREIEHARAGRSARIVAKMNSLADTRMISALYDASRAGVSIDLIVRSICCLRPGVPGLSENIRVISIVGRFLEHERIFYFSNGGQEEVYLGSGDWMERNFDRRVDILFPIDDVAIKNRLIDHILLLNLMDNVQVRELTPDGTYRRRQLEGRAPISVQEILLSDVTPQLGTATVFVRPPSMKPATAPGTQSPAHVPRPVRRRVRAPKHGILPTYLPPPGDAGPAT